MGVEPRDAALREGGAQARIDAGGMSANDAFGGRLVVDGANRGIGLLMAARKRATTASSEGFGASDRSWENSGNPRERSMRAFAFSLLR